MMPTPVIGCTSHKERQDKHKPCDAGGKSRCAGAAAQHCSAAEHNCRALDVDREG